MLRVVTILMFISLTLTSLGCGHIKLRMPTLRKPVPVEEVVVPARWTPYPQKAPLGDDWNIIVKQSKDALHLTNQTPRSYQNVQLWVNQQYIADVPSIAIGSGTTVKLASFINQHHEIYPVPGFLTPDHSFPVLLCEIFDQADGQRHRLLVRQ